MHVIIITNFKIINTIVQFSFPFSVNVDDNKSLERLTKKYDTIRKILKITVFSIYLEILTFTRV